MLHSFRHDEHLPFPEAHRPIREIDLQRSLEDDEGLVRVGMLVPDELTLDPGELELNVVQLRHDLRLPLVGEEIELPLQVYGVSAHGEPPWDAIVSEG